MEQPAIVDRMRRAAGVLAEHGDPLGDLLHAVETLVTHGGEACLRVAERLQAALHPDAAGLSFAAAIGLSATARRAARDELLHRLATEFFPRVHDRKLAAAISAAVLQVETTSWARRAPRPAGRDGAIYDLLALGGIPTESRMRQIFRMRIGQSGVCRLTKIRTIFAA